MKDNLITIMIQELLKTHEQYGIYLLDIFPEIYWRKATYIQGKEYLNHPYIIRGYQSYMWVLVPDVPLISEWMSTSYGKKTKQRFLPGFKKIRLYESTIRDISRRHPFANWVEAIKVNMPTQIEYVLASLMGLITFSLPKRYQILPGVNPRVVDIIAPLQTIYPDKTTNENKKVVIADIGRIKKDRKGTIRIELLTGTKWLITKDNQIAIKKIFFTPILFSEIKQHETYNGIENFLDVLHFKAEKNWKTIKLLFVADYQTTYPIFRLHDIVPIYNNLEDEAIFVASILAKMPPLKALADSRNPIHVQIPKSVYNATLNPTKGYEMKIINNKTILNGIGIQRKHSREITTWEYINPMITYNVLKYLKIVKLDKITPPVSTEISSMSDSFPFNKNALSIIHGLEDIINNKPEPLRSLYRDKFAVLMKAIKLSLNLSQSVRSYLSNTKTFINPH